MIIRFKNGSRIKYLPGGECKRSKRGQKQIDKIGDYWLKYPDKFLEEVQGLRLFPCQRAVLRIIRGYDEICKRIKNGGKKNGF